MKYTSINKVLADKISGEWGVEPEDDSWVKVIRTANFTNLGVIDYSNIVLRKIGTKKVELKKLISGDVIIEKSGGSPKQPVGRVVYFENPDSSIYLCNNFTTILRPNKSIVFPKYLFYVLFYNHLTKRTLRFQNRTTGIINLKLGNYLKSEIPLPPLEDQIRIAAVLTRAEKLIAKRKESIKALDELLKSTFMEMFGDPVRNEKRWTLAPLGEKLSIKHGFAFPGENFSSIGEYVLLTPGNFFEEGGYRDRGDKQKYYQGEIPKEYLLSKDDLLIAMTEQAPGLLGSPLIVPGSNKFLHNQRLGLVIYKTDDLNRLYLFHLFNQHNIRKLIHLKATGTKVRHTSPSKIEEIKVSIPPLSLQNQFAALVEKVEGIKAKYAQSLIELENLYASLSQRAFKGELDLSKAPMDRENEIIELQGEVESAPPMDSELSASKIYSEAELKKIIQSLAGEAFSFDSLMTVLEKDSFEEMPEYEELKKQLFTMLEGTNPLLSQSFDKVKKEIVLRVNL